MLVSRKRKLSAVVSFVVCDNDRLPYCRYKAKKRGLHYQQDVSSIPLFEMLTGNEYGRMLDHVEQAAAGDDRKVADLDQHVSHYCGGDTLGCLVTHAKIIRLDTMEIMHPLEMMLAQGAPQFSTLPNVEFTNHAFNQNWLL